MTDRNIEKIEAFIGGDMNPEELQFFERELEADETLLATYNTYKAVETDMQKTKQHITEAALKSKLVQLGTEFFPASSKTSPDSSSKELSAAAHPESLQLFSAKRPRFRITRIWQLNAAILLGVIMVATWLIVKRKENTEGQIVISKPSADSLQREKKLTDTASPVLILPDFAAVDSTNHKGDKHQKNGKSKNTPRLLFAEYFTPDPAPANSEGPLEDGFVLYEQKQYADAAVTFENADPESVTRSEGPDIELTRFYAAYYKSLSCLAIHQDAKAIKQLKDLVSPDPILQAKIQWYLALAYLRTNDVKAALVLLGAIQNNNRAGKYKLQAGKLMIELKEIQ